MHADSSENLLTSVGTRPAARHSIIVACWMVLAASAALALPSSAAPPDSGQTHPLVSSPGPDVAPGPALSGQTVTTTSAVVQAPTGTAPEKQPQTPAAVPAESTTAPGVSSTLDTIQVEISKGLLSSATWLDSFFYDPRYAVEENRTRAVVRYELFDEEHAHWSFKTRLQFVLILPQLQKKAHLIIAGDPDEQTADLPEAGATPTARPLADTARQSSAALGYLFKSNERQNISARVGLRYRSGHIVAFIRPHYRILYHLDSWDLRITQEFPYWTDTKWQSVSVVDLERRVGRNLFFRTSVIGSKLEHVPGNAYSLVFSLTQPLSSTRALEYSWSNDFQTRAAEPVSQLTVSTLPLPRPIKQVDQLAQVSFATRYRQQFWREWMFFEIVPQIRFPRDRRFNPVPGILFRIEMQFGKQG